MTPPSAMPVERSLELRVESLTVSIRVELGNVEGGPETRELGRLVAMDASVGPYVLDVPGLAARSVALLVPLADEASPAAEALLLGAAGEDSLNGEASVVALVLVLAEVEAADGTDLTDCAIPTGGGRLAALSGAVLEDRMALLQPVKANPVEMKEAKSKCFISGFGSQDGTDSWPVSSTLSR